MPPNRPFYPHGNPSENDGPHSDRSLGGSRGGGFGGARGGRGAPRGESSRSGSWKRTDGEPRSRPAAVRLAAARADLERMIRELENASKALSAPEVKIPATSILEHTKELDLDALFAPWRRVRAALADVERVCVAIDLLKFPPKPFVPRDIRPRM